MGPTFTAMAMAFTAVIAALLVRPRGLEQTAFLRAAAFWLCSIPILFLLKVKLVALLLCGALAAALAPRSKAERLGFYILALPAVPASFSAAIPFPGINYLIIINFSIVLFIFVLLQSLFAARQTPTVKYAPPTSAAIVIFSMALVALSFRDQNLTSGLRAGVEVLLSYTFLYFGAVHLIDSKKNFDHIFSSFIFLSIILFFSGFITQFRDWNYYSYLSDGGFADVRGGILRVEATLVPALVGFVNAIGIVATSYFRDRKKLNAATAWLLRIAFMISAALTYSRGAWLAMFASLAVYYFFTRAPKTLRPILMWIIMLILTPATFVLLLNSNLNSIDNYGTFSYRQELLKATWIHAQQFPLFGDANFIERPHFAHLRQGQGIIDFVNYYVQIVVEYGFVGLILFLAPWVLLIIGLLRLPRRDPKFWGGPSERIRAALLSIVIGYLVLAATISAVSYIAHFGVLILAVGAGFLSVSRLELNQRPGPSA